jgi:N-acetylmuramoyl-L-alanine amidase
VRVVVIDAGHGGYDPGTIGVGGVREKNVALGIALALAEALRREPDLEVHLLRDDDTFIEVWDRGQMATDIRGERPGVFISLHANSLPNRGNAKGFETYFLSEARTDHERRVAAIENAPISVRGDGTAPSGDLDFILRELRNLDHQHWSALLAGNIQEEVERIHPGPNRGVKQAPMAVITNALMPAVLVEIGYLSDAQEARLLVQESFQRDAAGAIAQAVVRFFERYPPGSGGGGGEVRP